MSGENKFPFYLLVYAVLQEFQRLGVSPVRFDLVDDAVGAGIGALYRSDYHPLINIEGKLDDQLYSVVGTEMVGHGYVDARHIGRGQRVEAYKLTEYTNRELQLGELDLSHPLFELMREQVRPLLAKEAKLEGDFHRELRDGERKVEEKYKRLAKEAGFR